jgi:drug/metabolite transporter (DMT)-like permease
VRIVVAVLMAAAASTLYAASTSLQALEARQVPSTEALRASLLARLVRRPLWLLGVAAGAAAWPVQAGALALASVAIVQPALGLGLIVLLVLGATVLGEAIGGREVAGAFAIAIAVAILGWAAPSGTGHFGTGATWAVVAAVPAIAALPYVLRWLRQAGGLPTSVAAGIGWAWVGLATSLLDAALARHAWGSALGFLAAVALVSWSALLAEMTSIQSWPATRAIPIAFGLEMILPAALAPALTSAASPHPLAFSAGLVLALAGAGVLGSSRAVARAAVAAPVD